MGWLAAIAQNEIRDQIDYHHRNKRDAALNVALEDNQLAAHVRSQVSLIQLERDAEQLEEALERLDKMKDLGDVSELDPAAMRGLTSGSPGHCFPAA